MSLRVEAVNVDTKRARFLAASLNREGLDYDEEEAMLVRLAYEVERLEEKLLQAVDFIDFKHRPLLAAAKGCINWNDDGSCDTGYERELREAIAACEEKP